MNIGLAPLEAKRHMNFARFSDEMRVRSCRREEADRPESQENPPHHVVYDSRISELEELFAPQRTVR